MNDISDADASMDADALLAALPARVGHTVQRWARDAPERLALVDRAGQWTYGDLARAISDVASALQAHGVCGGDRVMIAAENCRAAVAVFFATTKIDAWPVLVDARLSAAELDGIRQDCSPRLILVAAGVSPAAHVLAERLGAAQSDFGGMTGVFCASCEPQLGPEPVSADSASQVAAVIYTSGSTGSPRGVMLSHRSILFVAACGGRIRTITPDDRFYAVMPLSHSVGLVPVLVCGLMHGASIHLVSRFNPADAMRAFRNDGMTVVLGTPALYSLMLEYVASKKIHAIDSPSLRIISASGAPLDATLKRRTEALFGLELHHGYGLTECSCTISQVRPEQPRSDLSVGQILPGLTARLDREEDGIGELQLRGPNLMLGYYRNPEATRACFTDDGWFRTGDLARWEGKNLFIVGRLKDLIIRNGFKIQPLEVEAVLNAHPDVVLSAVVSRKLGGDDVLMAYIQKRPGGALSADALQLHASARLASFKQPQRIVILEHLPLLPSGKVNKAALAPP